MFWGTYGTLWWVVGGLVVLAILLVRVGLAHFQREELLGREIDVLNIRWMWGVFSRSFTAGAENIFQWYCLLYNKTIKKMRLSILITTLLAILGFFLGAQLIDRFYFNIDSTSFTELEQRADLLVKAWPMFDFRPVLTIWWHNTRAILAAVVLGSFSLGILGVLPVMLTMGITGYLMALLHGNGFPIFQFVFLLLPHGIIEISAVIIGTASVFHAGVLMGTTTRGKTVGEAWLTSLAEWVQLLVGIVLPLVFIAAMIEAWVTPKVAMWLIR